MKEEENSVARGRRIRCPGPGCRFVRSRINSTIGSDGKAVHHRELSGDGADEDRRLAGSRKHSSAGTGAEDARLPSGYSA